MFSRITLMVRLPFRGDSSLKAGGLFKYCKLLELVRKAGRDLIGRPREYYLIKSSLGILMFI